MKNLAVIPARSGSKGVRDKNIKLLNGKPLMAYSIEAAIASQMFDTIHVSTDSERYAEIAREYGADVPFLRSAETSSDTASSWDAVLEVLENYKRRGKRFDTVTLLQPTSPLRGPEDIAGAYAVMRERRAAAVVSVCEAEHPPQWYNTLPEDGCMDGFVRADSRRARQSLEKYYQLNGAIYTVSVPALQEWGTIMYGTESYAYVMPQTRSIDIDEPMDFLIVEMLLRNRERL